jgi:hypothetical protein
MKEGIYKDSILVFDEFDHMMKKSMTDTPQTTKQDWTSMLAVTEGEERKQILDMMK